MVKNSIKPVSSIQRLMVHKARNITDRNRRPVGLRLEGHYHRANYPHDCKLVQRRNENAVCFNKHLVNKNKYRFSIWNISTN